MVPEENSGRRNPKPWMKQTGALAVSTKMRRGKLWPVLLTCGHLRLAGPVTIRWGAALCRQCPAARTVVIRRIEYTIKIKSKRCIRPWGCCLSV